MTMNPSGGDGDDDMHREVDWLRPSDRPITKKISDYNDDWVKAPTLALNLPYTRRHISNRCRELSDHGLLERHDDAAAYRITDKGRDFLEDNLKPSDLLESDDDSDTSELENDDE